MKSLYLVGMAFALFFALLLYNKPQRRLADHILCAWFLMFVLHLLDYYIAYAGFEQMYPHFLGIGDGLPFLYGPFLYFYVWALVEPDPVLHFSDVRHLIPIFGYYLIYVPFFLTEANLKHQVYDAGITTVPFLLELGIIAKLLSLPVYLIWVVRKFRQHGARTELFYSNTESVDLQWLRNVTWGLGLFWLFMMGTLAADALWGVSLLGGANGVVFGALAVGVICLGYFGVRQGAIFTLGLDLEPALSEVISPETVKTNDAQSYQRSGLKKEDAQEHLIRLHALMDNEKPYLNSDLTIEDIATHLEISGHHLTEVLNAHLGKNFYLFINEYRVKEAQNRLVDPQNNHMTLLAIGLESGFNSKSSFNAAFKRLTSTTPSQYRRTHAPDPSTA